MKSFTTFVPDFSTGIEIYKSVGLCTSTVYTTFLVVRGISTGVDLTKSNGYPDRHWVWHNCRGTLAGCVDACREIIAEKLTSWLVGWRN